MRLLDFTLFTVQISLIALVRTAQPPPVPIATHGEQPGQHKFGDHNEVHDSDHIKQHLQDRIDVNEMELNEEQQRFHYFSMHDLNKDNRIDGSEIIKAMIHEHNSAMSDNSQQTQMSESSLESLTDSILQEIDMNNDGFVDYGEYIKNQID